MILAFGLSIRFVPCVLFAGYLYGKVTLRPEGVIGGGVGLGNTIEKG